MEFEFYDERRLFDTYTVPDSISDNHTGSDAHANGYADSFSNPHAHSRT